MSYPFKVAMRLNKIEEAIEDKNDVTPFISFMMARLFILRTGIPNEPIKDRIAYFNSTVCPDLVIELNSINEHYILDIDAIIRFTKDMWLLEYRNRHDVYFALTEAPMVYGLMDPEKSTSHLGLKAGAEAVKRVMSKGAYHKVTYLLKDIVECYDGSK